MIAIWRLIKSGGWIAIPMILATIQVMNWTVVSSRDNKIKALQADTTKANLWINVLEVNLNHQADSLQIQHSQINELQALALQMRNSKKLLETQNKHLLTGIRIDLLEKTYRDHIFAKRKLIDSTYTVGWRYGAIDE